MPQYAFYPEKLDRSSATLEVFELAGDAQALVRAELVMSQHSSSGSVAVWQEDRLVLTLFRRSTVRANLAAHSAAALEFA